LCFGNAIAAQETFVNLVWVKAEAQPNELWLKLAEHVRLAGVKLCCPLC